MFCGNCNGTGWIGGLFFPQMCEDCLGTGEIEDIKQVDDDEEESLLLHGEDE